MDRTSSILTFSNRSLELLTLKNRFLIRAKALHSMRTCLTMQGIWHVKQRGCCSCFRLKEWVSLVWPMRYRNIMTCSRFPETWSPFSQSGLDIEETIVDVIISALLPFCMKVFIHLGFQVVIWSPEFVWGSDLRFIWMPSLLFHFLSLQCGLGSRI